jgi:hypothetical protein
VDEASVLEMQIDTDKVTVDDLDRYESLMNGSTTFGKSNATSQKGLVDGHYAKHSWDLSSHTGGAGPLELRL